jgi:glucosyl-3-phosphoglycerate synthase
VCIPCRNEAATIGPIVRQIIGTLMNTGDHLVDELIVMDDGSTDATAAVASAAGARVVAVADVLPHTGPAAGKGNALWKSVAASRGDVVVWCDGDLLSFTPEYIRRLVLPFLMDPSVMFVKGFYERLLDQAGEGGGRNTELVARPLLALLFPDLATVRQPLGGEYAARRTVLEQIPFATGYGVEIGLLLDVAALTGASSVVQVDLGVRRHRHRPLRELSAQSVEIMHALLRRAGLAPDRLRAPSTFPESADGTDPLPSLRPTPLHLTERPPLLTVDGYPLC